MSQDKCVKHVYAVLSCLSSLLETQPPLPPHLHWSWQPEVEGGVLAAYPPSRRHWLATGWTTGQDAPPPATRLCTWYEELRAAVEQQIQTNSGEAAQLASHPAAG